jgi:hypothetical protein
MMVMVCGTYEGTGSYSALLVLRYLSDIFTKF